MYNLLFSGGLSGVGLFYRKHKRSPSHNNLKYGRENSPPDSPLKQKSNPSVTDTDNSDISNSAEVSTNVVIFLFDLLNGVIILTMIIQD